MNKEAPKKRYARKNALDQFYTKPEVAKQFIDMINVSQFKTVIEPSAGSGSFSQWIPNCIALDISPKLEGIIQCDFFEYASTSDQKDTLVIGNPPFGKQNNLAIRFINRAATMADTIAFILPLSFMKISVQNKIALTHHLMSADRLQPNSFIFEDNDYDVPSVFQIWKKQEINRIKQLPEKPIGFHYVPKKDADFSIRRVGFYAGRADLSLEKNEQSHLFVKLDDPSKAPETVQFLNDYLQQWKHNDTVGPRTVSTFDLNRLLNSKFR